MDPDEEELQLQAQARMRMAQSGAPAAAQPVGIGEDMARSAPTGIYHGMMAMAALPGGIDALLSAASNFANRQLGLPEQPRMFGPGGGASRAIGADRGILPTGPELEAQLGKDIPAIAHPYEAQTPIGKFTESVASFVPGAIAMPAKSAAEVGGNLLKYAVTPELTGKTAKSVAAVAGAGERGQQIAETAGQLVGGGVGMLKDRPAAVPITTAEEVASGVGDFYKAARAKGVVYTPDAYKTLANDIGQSASKMKFNDVNFPGASAVVKHLGEMIGAAPDLEELYQLRQQAGGVVNAAARSGNSNDLRAGMMIKHKIDDFFAKDSPDRVMAGDPSGVGDLLKQGQILRVKQDKMEIVQDAYRNAELSRVGQTDMDTALSNEFRKIAKSRDFGKFTAEEQAAIEEVVKKSKTEKVGTFLEQFANPRSPRTALVGSGVGAAAAMGVGIPWQVGAAIPPALGVAGRAIAQGVTARQAAQAEQLIAGGAMRPPWSAARRGLLPLSVPLSNMATIPPPGGR